MTSAVGSTTAVSPPPTTAISRSAFRTTRCCARRRLQCKGFLTPEDIATVDMQGNQIAGRKKRSSEALLHLEIYKQRADVKSVVHCHPPHATAFAIAREAIPQCVLPEVEVFLGDVPITKYETPGGKEFAETILPFVAKTNVIILANHGTVSFGETVETAYWWTEILDSYCRMLMLARSLGPIHYVGETERARAAGPETEMGLSRIRGTPRNTKNCDVCANDIFRNSWQEANVERLRSTPPRPFRPRRPPRPRHPLDRPWVTPNERALIEAITDRVVAALKGN